MQLWAHSTCLFTASHMRRNNTRCSANQLSICRSVIAMRSIVHCSPRMRGGTAPLDSWAAGNHDVNACFTLLRPPVWISRSGADTGSFCAMVNGLSADTLFYASYVVETIFDFIGMSSWLVPTGVGKFTNTITRGR